MSGQVDYELDGDVAVLTVDNPPVNALSSDVRAGLADAVARFERDADARIAVIVGAGRLFIGGADIGEFGKPPRPPALPGVIRSIERCPKPIVAAIHGTALGGGLEVALGAHHRLAFADAKLGLPEVMLGLMPGAGGTQRLPRLIGVERALDMITGGRPVSGEKGLEIGLVDRVVGTSGKGDEGGTSGESERVGRGDGDAGSDVRTAAIAFARELLELGETHHPTGERAIAPVDAGVLAERRTALERTARGQVAPLAAVDAVEIATRTSIEDGLAEERRLFLELMDTPQRAGLIHAFFAERRVAKLPEIEGVAPRELERAGVIGGGTMGAGIATSFLLAGLTVTLIERDVESGERARSVIGRNLDAAVKRGKLGRARRDTLLDEAFAIDVDHAALADADLIVEAVFEDMAVKRAVFARLDEVARPGAILATNTSYLDVNEIARATSRPGEVIGLHFFSPAHVMKLLEVVVADATAADVVASAFALAKRLGKVGVRAGVADGFIGNRILARYRAAADHLVLDGASPYQVDRAMRAFGFAMGPYEVSDLAGLDIGHATRRRKAPDRHPRERVPTFADALFEAGRLGRKTGRGYYLYEEGARRGAPDPDLERIVAEAREAAGIVPRAFDDEEIVRRYLAAMIDEGARVVADGTAARPLDVDVVFVHGYGFPRHRGGPMKHADTVGIERVLADIRTFAGEDDHFWRPAPLLEQLVAEGRTFQDLNDEDRAMSATSSVRRSSVSASARSSSGSPPPSGSR